MVLMLKAGSSSVGSWLYQVEGNSRPAEFAQRLFGDFHGDEVMVCGKFLRWIFGAEGLGLSVQLGLKRIIPSRVSLRFHHAYSLVNLHSL